MPGCRRNASQGTLCGPDFGRMNRFCLSQIWKSFYYVNAPKLLSDSGLPEMGETHKAPIEPVIFARTYYNRFVTEVNTYLRDVSRSDWFHKR